MSEQQGYYQGQRPKYSRLGKFRLPRQLVETGMSGEVLEKMKFTPMRVECLGYCDEYEHIGLSWMFDEMNEAESLPLYQVNWSIDEVDGEPPVVMNVDVQRVYA